MLEIRTFADSQTAPVLISFNQKTGKEGRTMLVNKGGQRVEKGTYWNPADGHRVDMKVEGILPGHQDNTYLRIPAGGMLVLAPLAGLLYVVLIPVFGLIAIAGMWLAPVAGLVAGTALTGVRLANGTFTTAGKSMSFGWTPSTVHLAGRKRARRR
jgi:hypothetical protein